MNSIITRHDILYSCLVNGKVENVRLVVDENRRYGKAPGGGEVSYTIVDVEVLE